MIHQNMGNPNRIQQKQHALPSWELTYPLPRHVLKMMFLFSRWDMLVPWRVNRSWSSLRSLDSLRTWVMAPWCSRHPGIIHIFPTRKLTCPLNRGSISQGRCSLVTTIFHKTCFVFGGGIHIIWMFPKIGVPQNRGPYQNGWFWGYPYSWKHPYHD